MVISGLFRAILLGIALTLAPSPGHARADSAKRVLFILDASGSMGQKSADRRSRFEHAKDQLRDQSSKYAAGGFEMGLFVFAHRQGGCDDIELKVPMRGSGAETQISDRISKLEPHGATPLTKSIEAAASYIKSNRMDGTEVVIISDGADTCGGDAIKAAHDLYASTHSSISIIGLDVMDEDLDSLQKVAAAGSGYFQRQFTGTVDPTSSLHGPQPRVGTALPQLFGRPSAIPGSYAPRAPRAGSLLNPLPDPGHGREGAPDDSQPIIDPNSVPKEMSFNPPPVNAPLTPMPTTIPPPPVPPTLVPQAPPKSPAPKPRPTEAPPELPMTAPMLM